MSYYLKILNDMTFYTQLNLGNKIMTVSICLKQNEGYVISIQIYTFFFFLSSNKNPNIMNLIYYP